MPAIDPDALPTQSFGWGAITWLVSPATTPGTELSFGEVVLLPGQGHERHNHPASEEILHVLSGTGEQTVEAGDDAGAPFAIGPGDTIHVPLAAFHATRTTGWEPLRLLAVYRPAGPERDLEGLPDFRAVPPGGPPDWRSGGG